MLQGCPLFPTKPENISAEVQIAMDTAEYFRKLNRLNLLPELDEITTYEFTCYDAAESASDKVQSDKQAEMNAENEGTKKKRPNKLNEGDKSGITW